MNVSSSLIVNAAFRAGLIRWIDQSNAWRDLEQLVGLKSNILDIKDSRDQVLLYNSRFLVFRSVGSHDLSSGWKQKRQQVIGSIHWVGCLCRQGPSD